MNPQSKAQQGLKFLEESIIDLLQQHSEGLRNADIAAALDIRSDHNGKQKDYLSYSLLGRLMKDGKVNKSGRIYTLAHHEEKQ